MNDLSLMNRSAVLFQIEEPLGAMLASGLRRAGCNVTSDATPSAQIVFCAAAAGVLRQALSQFQDVPVVVVSRLPDIDEWLDALEAGAADYCTAPFEPAQLQWILAAHRRPLASTASA